MKEQKYTENEAPHSRWLRYKHSPEDKMWSYACENCRVDAIVRPTAYCPSCGFDMRDVQTGDLIVFDVDVGESIVAQEPFVDKTKLMPLATLYYVGECYGKPITSCATVIEKVGNSYLTRNGLIGISDIDTNKEPYYYTRQSDAEAMTQRLIDALWKVELGDEFFVITNDGNTNKPYYNSYVRARVSMYHPDYASGDMDLVEIVEDGSDRTPRTFHTDIGKVMRESGIYRSEAKAKACVDMALAREDEKGFAKCNRKA